MPECDNVLVCLDRTIGNEALIRFAGAITKAVGTQTVHFFHRVLKPDLPAEFVAKHPDILEPAAEAEKAIRAQVDDLYDGPAKVVVTCATEGGSAPADILRFAKDQDVDLILVGRDSVKTTGGPVSATMAKRLASNATCSVLAVSPEDEPRFARVLVPFRASDCSAAALEVAIRVARRFPGCELICHYVYQVHSGYRRTGASYEEYIEALEQQARKEYDEILGRVDSSGISISLRTSADEYDKPAQVIAAAVAEQAVDLVVVGAHGRTGAAGMLLGRVTEQLIGLSPAPVLAVKKKGELIGLLEAILTGGR
jgi:nucleotide-binding universal stress UspA family protein